MNLPFVRGGVVLVATGALLPGCADRYIPRAPVTSETKDVRAKLVHVRGAEPPTLAEVALRAKQPARVGKVWVTSPLREPCTGGAEVEDVRVDGAEAQRSLSGVHVLRALMPEDALAGERMLDIALDVGGRAQCLRIPVVSHVQSYERRPSPFISGAVEIEAFPVHGEEALIGVALGAGYVARSVRARVSAGVASATCKEAECGSDGDGQLARSSRAIPARVQIDHYPVAWVDDLGWRALGVGVRYSIVQSHVPSLRREYDLLSHGVHAVLSLTPVTAPLPRGFREHPTAGSLVTLEIPVGVWISTHEDETETKLGVGLNFRADGVL